ncbi:MAG: substrate-binding domain-containing protein [Kiritimatiellae bacterium]|nr:substrate-binding domain-containing protein [Kiritimatiellia bacterium]
MTRANVIYLDYGEDSRFHRLRLEGISRFARTRGWKVIPLPPQKSRPCDIAGIISAFNPLGFLVERTRLDERIPARFFKRMPVVIIDPQDNDGPSRAPCITCDNAAVARAAFAELSKNLPPVYAAVPYRRRRIWSRVRIAEFSSLCAESGKKCIVFPFRPGESSEARFSRLKLWANTLPPHCAIFAVNDYTAWLTASALHACGRNIPRSATLIGVDGFDRLFDGSDSWISSVKLDFERTGFIAARMLAEQISARAAGLPPPCAARTELFGPLLVQRRESTRGSGRRDQRVIDAVSMIRREAASGLTARELAARFDCSRNLFERRFREAMGRSVLDEIINVRMETARSLLSRRDFPIGAVAAFCGFRSDRALQKLFKERTGLSLRDWRKANLL